MELDSDLLSKCPTATSVTASILAIARKLVPATTSVTTSSTPKPIPNFIFKLILFIALTPNQRFVRNSSRPNKLFIGIDSAGPRWHSPAAHSFFIGIKTADFSSSAWASGSRPHPRIHVGNRVGDAYENPLPRRSRGDSDVQAGVQNQSRFHLVGKSQHGGGKCRIVLIQGRVAIAFSDYAQPASERRRSRKRESYVVIKSGAGGAPGKQRHEVEIQVKRMDVFADQEGGSVIDLARA